ncbi:MAG TPA: 4-hydroxy-2-oxovalerate aldolase [Methanocorpusculum sp.]|nr:4-hydroxy-2-oxovalerate aldolase [Methanocorpusculum sp.]
MKILDTTIRDGSYAVDFNFTSSDVRTISSKLEEMGIELIEIGHGMGLHASSPKNGVCAQTDEEYLQVASETLSRSKFGMFCIPGIARLEDLQLASDYGASFVRVGINADQVPLTEPYIREAEDLGLTVMTNYMKSYVLTPEIFAENVLLSEKYGADCVYVVDSAGSMFPDEIKKYYDAVREVSEIQLGFHGHNNLGLAVSNSAYCAHLGFDFIDCSLQGLGRSSGNASTEMVMAILEKKGYQSDIDLVELFSAGYDLLHPITDRKLTDPFDYVCGYAGFHTSFLKYIRRCANEYNVNPYRLIIEYAKYDQANMDYKKLCRIAMRMKKISLPRNSDTMLCPNCAI